MTTPDPKDMPTEVDLAWERETLPTPSKVFESRTKLREQAAAWEKSIAGVLGVFATVALIKGPETFADVPAPGSVISAGLILMAAGLAALATFRAARASQGEPEFVSQLYGRLLRDRTIKSLKQGADDLSSSRTLAISAALLVLLGVATAWLSESFATPEPPAQHALVVTSAGSVLCGELGTKGGFLTLTPEGGQAAPVADATQITYVASCPK